MNMTLWNKILCQMLAAALAWLLSPGAAQADRHCAPVLEEYYQARIALRKQLAPCDTAVQKGLDLLLEAADQARICGCLSLQTDLVAFVEAQRVSGASCAVQRAAVLDHDKTLSKQVAACQ